MPVMESIAAVCELALCAFVRNFSKQGGSWVHLTNFSFAMETREQIHDEQPTQNAASAIIHRTRADQIRSQRVKLQTEATALLRFAS